jgi:alpha-galactosidase
MINKKSVTPSLLILSVVMLFLNSSELYGQVKPRDPFHINYAGIDLSFSFFEGHLRQTYMLPENLGDKNHASKRKSSKPDGLEVALQCSGANRLDQNPSGGTPGNDLKFIDTRRQPTANGEELIIYQEDTLRHLLVESHYEFFKDIPVIRRFTVIENIGTSETGIEYVSSAMLNNIGSQGQIRPDEKLLIHYSQNNWTSEAQWKAKKAKDLGWYYNGGLNVGEVSFTSTGSMSTAHYLPMAAIEDTETGVTWFWQIEHSGPWHWELGGSKSTYFYIGGPDEKHHDAWKNLKPGEKYVSAPVAIGCVKGNFNDAVVALTNYRRKALLPANDFNKDCPVIFNDYMNCLKGNPTTKKELPLIDVASEVGCDYYVVDAGWYGELNKGWWDEIGAWQPTKSRFPNGIMEVMNHIKDKGMHPGLWLEIELAGINSPLKNKPDDWFFMQHGKRVIEGGRYFLDFRNPEVVSYCDSVVNRLVKDYGVDYIKRDYNCAAPFGTDFHAESTGQGMLQNVRTYVAWIDSVFRRYPNLIIENCSGCGMRTDYMMLSRHQIQSSSDQEDYRKYPSILVGSLAAVLPEQLAVWSYPLKSSDAVAASFNMVSSMLCRIHLSGELDKLKPESKKQVINGIAVYKEKIRQYIPQSVPFFPLGMPSITNTVSPVALGLKHADKQFIAVWRLEGVENVILPVSCKKASVLYPVNLEITVATDTKNIMVNLPEKYMAVILEVE